MFRVQHYNIGTLAFLFIAPICVGMLLSFQLEPAVLRLVVGMPFVCYSIFFATKHSRGVCIVKLNPEGFRMNWVKQPIIGKFRDRSFEWKDVVYFKDRNGFGTNNMIKLVMQDGQKIRFYGQIGYLPLNEDLDFGDFKGTFERLIERFNKKQSGSIKVVKSSFL